MTKTLKVQGNFDLSKGIRNARWSTAFDDFTNIIMNLGFLYELTDSGCQTQLDCVYKTLVIFGTSEKALKYIKVVETILENSDKFVKTEDTEDLIVFEEK